MKMELWHALNRGVDGRDIFLEDSDYERGLYVEEQTTHADGMILVRNVGDDYFEYDEKRYQLLGRRTKKSYRLGDPIRVKLIAARIAEKELDFVPV